MEQPIECGYIDVFTKRGVVLSSKITLFLPALAGSIMVKKSDSGFEGLNCF
jgi:hypothetical protein